MASTIITHTIKPGAVFNTDLYHQSGFVLVPAGVPLTKGRLDAFRWIGIDDLVQPDKGDNLAHFIFQCRYEKISARDLREHRKEVPFDVYDGNAKQLARRGQTVTRGLLGSFEKVEEQFGLYRERSEKDTQLKKAKAFLHEYPVQQPKIKPASPDLEKPPEEKKPEAQKPEPKKGVPAPLPKAPPPPPPPPRSKAAPEPEPAPGPEPPPQPQAAEPSSGALKVLVAEDDKNIRNIMVKFLKDSGLTVWEAADGKEALKLADEHEPDVVLLDIMMPGVDGISVCRHLKTLGACSPVVIMCTAKTEREDIVNAMQGGADDYVVKPFESKTLLAKVLQHVKARSKP